jgi:hypothetical protein
MKHMDELLQRRTGFRPGSRVVTCPNCQTPTHGKFCGKCGYEITAVNYEVLQEALQSGSVTPEELTEGMDLIPGFKEKSARADEFVRSILDRSRVVLGT